MKGFKKMGKGTVKYMSAFPSGATPCGPQGAGCGNSCKSMVRSHSRMKPAKFAGGGSVDSAVVQRADPVTSADAEAGGRGSLRPGFARGGAAGRGKKMAGMAARLMKKGFSAEVAHSKSGGGGAQMSCSSKRPFSKGGMACGSKMAKKKCD